MVQHENASANTENKIGVGTSMDYEGTSGADSHGAADQCVNICINSSAIAPNFDTPTTEVGSLRAPSYGHVGNEYAREGLGDELRFESIRVHSSHFRVYTGQWAL